LFDVVSLEENASPMDLLRCRVESRKKTFTIEIGQYWE
jgi:hypothetical protein